MTDTAPLILPTETTLLDVIRRRADSNAPAVTLIQPNAAADGYQHNTLTYAQFFQQAAGFADTFDGIGAQRGDVVVLVLAHGEAVLTAFWGAVMLGVLPSIFPYLSDKLHPKTYFQSVRALVQHSNVYAVVTETQFADGLRDALHGLDVALVVWDDPHTARTNDTTAQKYLAQNITADDTAFLQHTSGSTGLQKGVMLTHGGVLNQLRAYGEAIQLKAADVIASWLPLYHDMGLIAGFILPLMCGIPLVLISPFVWVRDPKILLHAIKTQRATLCWLPNFAYSFMSTRISDANLQGADLSSIRAFVNCSEPVYAESHRVFRERFTPYGLRADALTVCYAMAENTFAVTQTPPQQAPKIDLIDRRAIMEARQAIPTTAADALAVVSCGAPIPRCRVRIVSEEGAVLDERHVGEVALQSDSMLGGYYRQADASARALRDGWYYSGDMGYLADGELYITGRKKDLIIVGGKNIYPQDIENLLNDITGIYAGRVVAFGVPNVELGTEDVAVLVEADDESVLESAAARGAILREVRARVAQHTDVSARYVQVMPPRWLEKTSSGKIARSANRARFLDELRKTEGGA
jgi:fatty-acyl-CoA synthase